MPGKNAKPKPKLTNAEIRQSSQAQARPRVENEGVDLGRRVGDCFFLWGGCSDSTNIRNTLKRRTVRLKRRCLF